MESVVAGMWLLLLYDKYLCAVLEWHYAQGNVRRFFGGSGYAVQLIVAVGIEKTLTLGTCQHRQQVVVVSVDVEYYDGAAV